MLMGKVLEIVLETITNIEAIHTTNVATQTYGVYTQ
jgi:hypothetical protein